MSLFKANVPPSRVPTLTEVVEVSSGKDRSPAPLTLGADVITQRVMADVQRQIDAMLEVRLKEALVPVVARLTDALARDARAELTKVMKDVVSRAVAKELHRTQSKS